MVSAEDARPKEIIATSVLTSDDGKPGLTGEYFYRDQLEQSVRMRVGCQESNISEGTTLRLIGPPHPVQCPLDRQAHPGAVRRV